MLVAWLALALTLSPAAALASDRLGYEREIDSSRYNQVPRHVDYILNEDFLALQKSRAKLVTKPRLEEAVASDNVVLESQVVRVVQPARLAAGGADLVRRRRGYNLENVRVPARFPYLPAPHYARFRRWG